MDPQTIINIMAGVIVSGLGWNISSLWKKVDQCSTKQEFQWLFQQIISRLDRLEERLDKQKDK